MSRALEGLTALPWGVHALVAFGMAAGLVIWLVGQRVLKPMLVTGLVILGGVLGGLVVPSASWGASLTIGHGIGIGAVGGLLIGLLLYRSAMAVGFGVVLGAALPLIAASVLQFYPIAPAGPASHAATGAWERIRATPLPEAASLPGLGGGVRILATNFMGDDSGATQIITDADVERILNGAQQAHARPESTESRPSAFIPPELRPAAEKIGEAWTGASVRAREEWESLPASHQAVIGLAGIIGLAGGVVAGLILPAWAGSTVTSLFGAAVWLPCFIWLSNALSAPWRSLLDRSPASWLAIWGACALAGMIFQWRTLAKRRARSKAATGAASPAAA